MTEAIEAVTTIGGRKIPYRVVHSKRARRLRVTVSGAEVTVTLPAGVRAGEAEKMLQQHAIWLLKQLDRAQRKKAPAKTLPPDVILLRGEVKQVEVITEADRQSRVRVDEVKDRLVIRAPRTTAGSRKTGRSLAVPWLKAQARGEIETIAKKQAARMGVSFRSITIRDQKTRWGSCSNRGTLSFNWRLVMAPTAVLEYVVIHELAHLKQANHSKAFWQVVAQYCPDYKITRAWLRSNASLLRPEDLL